jgi:hypothetical protein
MSLRLETTLAGYGRAAVDLQTRMWDVSQTSTARNYLRVLAEDVFADFRGDDRPHRPGATPACWTHSSA